MSQLGKHPHAGISPVTLAEDSAQGELAKTTAHHMAVVERLPPGFSDYAILKKVGQGGMATVLLARDPKLRRQVALKVQSTHDASELEQFMLEAQVTAQLEHPNIVPVYAFEGGPDGQTAYTMKLVEGKSLKEVITQAKADPSQALAQRLELFLKICDAIDYAHAKGVVHRDLKPANVMIGPFNEVYVLDWGLAKLVAQPDPELSAARLPVLEQSGQDSMASSLVLGEIDVHDAASRTIAGTLKGTPLYMAPEQATAEGDAVGPHSDQYALGLVLYELINLRRAYGSDDLVGVVRDAQNARVRPPNPAIDPPAELTAIVNKATAKQPRDRYLSVRRLARDVRCFLRNEETQALPDDLRRKLRRWLSQNPQRALALGLALVLFTVVTLVVGAARQKIAISDERLHFQRQAQATERLVGIATRRAQALSTDLLWFRALAEGLARAMSQALATGEPSNEPIYGSEAFADPSRAPSDIRFSGHYGKKISLNWPIHRSAPSDDPARGEEEVRRLSPLRHAMRDMFSSGPNLPAETRDAPSLDARILNHHVPMEWVYVATEATGSLVLYPGAKDMGMSPSYDPRTRSWYQESKAAWQAGRRRHFSRPYVDQMGQGLVVTATQACVGRDGRFIGVAAVDLGLEFLVSNHLRAPELPGFRRGYLIDPQGTVLLSSEATAKSPTHADGTLKLPAFPFPGVLPKILDSPSGLLREGEWVLAWSRTEFNGSTFVAQAEATALFGQTR